MTQPTLDDALIGDLIEPRYPRDYQLHSAAADRLLPLVGQLRLTLDGAEAGGPMTDPHYALTSGPVWEAVASALSTDDPAALVAGWLDMTALVRLTAIYGEVASGRYRLQNVTADELMTVLDGYPDMTLERAGINADGTVTLTEDKIALARNQQWRWTHYEIAEEIYLDGGWPGPAVDPKRVYGQMSYIELDMHRILSLPVERRDADGWIELTEAQDAELAALHLTMLPATQVFLENATLNFGADEVQGTIRAWAAW